MSIKTKKRLIIVLSVVLVLIVGSIMGVNLYADSILNRLKRPEQFNEGVFAVTSNYNVENIALLGIDNDEGGGARTDVMKIISLDYDNKSIKITSLQRDNIVYQPLMDRYEKLNHAYWRSGVQGTLGAINVSFDLDVEQYVLFDFDSVEEIVDILGGVDISLSNAEASVLGLGNGGVYHLNGSQTLAYSRIRSVDNDYERMARQNNVINALISTLKNKSVFELLGIINDVLPYIETNLSNGAIKNYVTSLLGFDLGHIQQYQFPKDGYGSQLTSLSLYGYSPQYVLKDYSGEVEDMHLFIYGENCGYTASERILKIEQDILKLAGY